MSIRWVVTRRVMRVLLLTGAMVLGTKSVGAQQVVADGETVPSRPEDPPPFSIAAWCLDATTICRDGAVREGRVGAFAGIRFVFEPQLGYLFQDGDDRFEPGNFASLSKFGFETNLYRGYVGLQLTLIYPNTITLDSLSVSRELLKNSSGVVDVEAGLGMGLTFFDGLLALGIGNLWYDERAWTDYRDLRAAGRGHLFRDWFGYFNIQAVQALKKSIGRLR